MPKKYTRKDNIMVIRRYRKSDEERLFGLFREEESWQDYLNNSGKYKKALLSCATYIAEEDGEICGYARCREDDGFGVYIYDLLVSPRYRGREIGRLLMEKVYNDFNGQTCYAMSDADGYYRKLGYKKIGSIFMVKPK
jgi:ribosomal protein S18 acetylase RimI-like enzyme